MLRELAWFDETEQIVVLVLVWHDLMRATELGHTHTHTQRLRRFGVI